MEQKINKNNNWNNFPKDFWEEQKPQQESNLEQRK